MSEEEEVAVYRRQQLLLAAAAVEPAALCRQQTPLVAHTLQDLRPRLPPLLQTT